MSYIPLSTLLLSTLFSVRIDASVYCYVCHWSKTSETVQDICSPGHLDTSKVNVDTCTTGCHTITFYEANETTMFSRLCSEKTVHRDECKEVEVVSYIRQKLCYCASNYCNAGDSSYHKTYNQLVITTLTWMVWNICCSG